MRTPLDDILQPDERVLWSGSPSSERLLMRNDYLWIPLGIVLGIAGLAGTLITLAELLAGQKTWINLIPALVALVLGWEAVIGHTIRRRRRALRTHYAVTDRRVIERVRGRRKTKTRSSSFADAQMITVRPQYEDRATIKVGAVTLFNVAGYERIESLIRQQLPADGA